MNNYRALVDRYFIVVSELRFAIEQALRDAGAEIPYPQKEVWIKPGSARPPTPAPPKNRS